MLATTPRHSDRYDTQFAKVSVAIWSGIHAVLVSYAIVKWRRQEEESSHIICLLERSALIALIRLVLAEELALVYLAACRIAVIAALATLAALIAPGVMYLFALKIVVTASVLVDLTVESKT